MVGGSIVTMEINQYIAALEENGTLLATAAETAGLAADVPACPGWQVRDLVRHQAYVHSWARRHVAERRSRMIEGTDEDELLAGGPPDDRLLAAYREGHAALVQTLRDADPQVRCATFMDTAPTPLGFWARRQAHETAIHRFDAQSARPGGAPPPGQAFDPGFAADGLDELITGFAAGRKYRARGRGQTLAVRPGDAPGRWHLKMGESGTEATRGERDADCLLEGPAAGLYAFLWNRATAAAAGVEVAGDPAVLDVWSTGVRVRWD